MLSFPKDTAAFSWTRHIKNKMVFYHLSGAQILRIFRKPARREEGIAPGTFAAMMPRTITKRLAQSAQRGDPRQEEIWIMYKMNGKRKTLNAKPGGKIKEPEFKRSTLHASRFTMISAWRYPGVTKPGERPPIPPEIAEELEKGIY